MATFGFSVGDFIACLQLVRDVVQALGESKGSASEYQSLFQTLVTLNQSLAASELVYLQWNVQATSSTYKTNGTAMINGILFERQKCKELLENFLKTSQPYTDAFVRERGKAVVRNWRKVKWLFQKEEAVKLEKQLQRHLRALRIFTDALFQNQTAANAEVMSSQVGSILSDVATIRTDVSIVVKALQSWNSPRPKSLGYPWEASASLKDNVLLLDANGRSVLLPMLFLSSPILLHDLLNIMYRGLPGHRRILRGEYNITDEENDGVLIEKSNWNSVIRPGMQISLNVVLRASTSWDTHKCPRCGEVVLGHMLQGKRRRCQKCQLTFRVFDRERITEDNEPASTSDSTKTAGTHQNSTFGSATSSNRFSYSGMDYNKEIPEDHIFQQVHYQRDIKKIDVPKPTQEIATKPPPRKLNIDELPPLHQAAATGNLSEIVSRLDAGDDINAPLSIRAIAAGPVSNKFDLYQCTPLHVASYFGKSKAMNLLLDLGASPTACDESQSQPLAYAIASEDPGLAVTLLARGADVNASDIWGRFAIHIACYRGATWLVRLLIQCGANVEGDAKLGYTAMHEAAWCGHEAVVSILLESNPDISRRYPSGYDLLHFLCFHGRGGAIKMLLDYGADITARDDYGDTLLHNAAWSGNVAIVEELLRRGADIESRNNAGLTPLLYACRKNRAAVVKTMLENGSDIKAKSKVNWGPIHYACVTDSEESLQILLDCGGDIESRDELSNSPLQVAAYNGLEKHAKLLISKGACVNTINKLGMTPLIYAAWRGYTNLVKSLLCTGAGTGYQNKNGVTALYAASGEGHEEVVASLLENGADYNIADQDGFDPLATALSNNRAGTAALLLQSGADPSKRYIEGHTPLHLASARGIDKCVAQLLSLGADVNAIDNRRGDTPLFCACYRAHASTIAILLSHGADPNIAQPDGYVPLAYVIIAGDHDREEIVRLLLKHGANPVAVLVGGGSALHCAVNQGNLGVVKALLESGVLDVNMLDKKGDKALDLAVTFGFKEIVELLLTVGGKGKIYDESRLPKVENAGTNSCVEGSSRLEEVTENFTI